MNPGNTPPDDERRDSASARNPAAARPAAADPSAARPASPLSTPASTQPRPTLVASDGQAAKHRIASGLPVQPPPLATARRSLRPSPPFLGSTKGTLGSGALPASASDPGDAGDTTPSAAMAKLATPLFGGSKAGRPVAPAAPKSASDTAMSVRAKTESVKAEIAKVAPTADQAQRPAPGKAGAVSPALARAASAGLASSSPTGKIALGAGDPEPPISGRPITPRSPRVALQPENVPAPKRPPEPTRPSRRARNPLVIVGNAIFTLLILALLVGGGAIVVGKSRFEAPGPLPEDKIVTIPPRSGMMDIADLLQREGVIDEHRLIFAGGVLALKARSDLKAGEYLFQKHASVRDVVETIVQGKVVQHQLTIPEGLTSEQIVARLLESDLLSGNIKDVPREGSLLPDSYYFHRGFSREQMIARMRQAQDRLMREVWERRNPDLPVRTPEQLLILSSIIEKETGKPEERTRVAAVFVNRLKQKMKLQSDPTIVYGLVFGKGSLGRPITRSDIQSQTPYNTYVIEGLPPGPITNPGRASIEAAANPARTKELFFVADGTGGHVFAETYDQHQKNVAKWRAIEQEARGERPENALPSVEVQPQPPPARTAPAATTPPRPKRTATPPGTQGNAPRSAGAQ